METKNAEPFAHGEEQDKRTCDFTTLLLLNLKRRLYDRLKQGCFRLGYRPNKDLLPQKRINNNRNDGEGSPDAEPSEPSSLTDQTNSMGSDVFFLCDGQWRSGDWQTVGANQVTRRHNSATVVRRRRMNLSPAKKIEDDFKARVSAVSQFSILQTFLPWLLPWIITVMMFMLFEKPGPHQLDKQRREKNLKTVRSRQCRSKHRRTNSGMKSIVPAGGSSLLLLAKSLPTQNRRSPIGPSCDTKRISTQCAAVARVNRLPVTGLPSPPRMIVTPPSSPRSSIHASDDVPRCLSSDLAIETSKETKSPTKADSLQPFKILSQSPKKIVIELDGVEQLGLLSQQLARADSIKSDVETSEKQELGSDSVGQMETSEMQKGCLVNCNGRSMEGMASEEVGIRENKQISPCKPIQSRKAHAINILRAKKARDMELARSRESEGSIDAPRSLPKEISRVEEMSKDISESDATPNSVSSSFMEEFFCEQIEGSNSRSGSRTLESDLSFASSVSSISMDSEVPSMSAQTWDLVRRNSRVVAPELNESLSTISNWPSIDEESSLDIERIPQVQVAKKESDSGDEKEQQQKRERLQEMYNPEFKPAPTKKSISPFSSASQQEPVMPKPQKPLPSTPAEPPPPPQKKPAFEEMVTEPRKPLPKKPPPPPPPPKSKEVKAQESVNKPPPPKSGLKGKKGPAPPPPPPGSNKRSGKGGSGIARAPKVIEMFQYVRKASKGKTSRKRHKSTKEAPADHAKLSSDGSGGDALIKELEKNSRYFAQIQSDVDTHGPAILKMIQEINTRKFESMSALNSFVKNIDSVLETFADETAVLRHFDWPQRYYTYREALALWSELKNRTEKCRHWVQGTRGISAELHRMKKYMEMNIRRMDEVQRTLEAEVKKFIRNGIPWEPSVLQKVHDGTMCLLEKYMQIVFDEVSRTQMKPTHREKNVQYLTDTINLTFKIHQFVGGLTESCTSLFEKIAAFTRTLNTDL